MEERVWSFSPRPWIIKLLQVCSGPGEGRFDRGAGLSGSGRDLCFTRLLVKQHAGGKLEQCCGFLIFWALAGRDAGPTAVQGSHSTCTAAHGSGWGAAASHRSGFAFSGVEPGVEIGAWGSSWTAEPWINLLCFQPQWGQNFRVICKILWVESHIRTRSRSDWKGGMCDYSSVPVSRSWEHTQCAGERRGNTTPSGLSLLGNPRVQAGSRVRWWEWSLLVQQKHEKGKVSVPEFVTAKALKRLKSTCSSTSTLCCCKQKGTGWSRW